MPTPKLFIRQYQDEKGHTFIFHRYWDNHSKDYEYQVYELKMAKPIARILGSPELNNTREMCDWVWDNVEEYNGHYVENKDK